MFDKQAYDATFATNIKDLTKAEKVTKQLVMELSRSVLEATHATVEPRYMNEFIQALSPVNKKVAVMYFTEFSGFRVEGNTFTKKDKANYEKASDAARLFLEDPHNNMWTWADREVDMKKKDFDISQVTQGMQRFIKKAEEANLSQADVLRAVFKAGWSVDAVMAVMAEIANPKKEEAQAE